jgi:sulfur-oxidizing protein SoxA
LGFLAGLGRWLRPGRWPSPWGAALAALLALAAVGCHFGAALAQPVPTASPAADPRRSGRQDMGPALQAMQADDSQNPAMLWVASGRERWAAECHRCHGPVEASMRGVAARYPSATETLNQRIRACRARPAASGVLGAMGASGASGNLSTGPAKASDQGGTTGPEAEPVLALQALVALQSRNLPVQPPSDAAARALAAEGEALFHRRFGALALSCADCHQARAGARLGGALIPQGHPTGYPIYRLEWQALGSFNRRLRACMVGVRATPFEDGSREALAIEAYLMRRAEGMAMEAPGVRP